jgi:hypothetical protein
LDFELSSLVVELVGRNDGLGFQSGVYDDHVGVYADDRTRDD